MNANELNLKKITFYSSGTAFYEYETEISSDTKFEIPFKKSQMDDVLKSLYIKDDRAKAIDISYDNENSNKFKQFSTLNNKGDFLDFLSSQKGTEVELMTISKGNVRGKIVSILKNEKDTGKSALYILTKGKIESFEMNKISSFSLIDEKKQEKLAEYLNYLNSTNSDENVLLNVSISGDGKRKVYLSYVVATAVFKPTYRMNYSNGKVEFKSYALIDNDTTKDWDDVLISLTNIKPVGFIQHLYQAYYPEREEVDLFQKASSPIMYDTAASGYGGRVMMAKMAANRAFEPEGDSLESDSGVATADLFTFVSPSGVSLKANTSAMINMSNQSFSADKYSVFSDVGAVSSHPKNCISFVNNSNISFPAAAATVYDNNVYVGDAIVSYIPQGGRSIVGYGDDLNVEGYNSVKYVSTVKGVSFSSNQLNIKRTERKTNTYTITNNSSETKKIILEHPVSSWTNITTRDLLEKTDTNYRYSFKLNPNEKKTFDIVEEEARYETRALGNLNYNFFYLYYTNSDIDQKTKDIFKNLCQIQSDIDAQKQNITNLNDTITQLKSKQERARQNLTAIGGNNEYSRDITKSIIDIEQEINTQEQNLNSANAKLQELNNKLLAELKKLQ